MCCHLTGDCREKLGWLVLMMTVTDCTVRHNNFVIHKQPCQQKELTGATSTVPQNQCNDLSPTQDKLYRTQLEIQASTVFFTSFMYRNDKAAPKFLRSSVKSSSESSLELESVQAVAIPGESWMPLAIQSLVASILTCPAWDISTTTLPSSSCGRGCFQGSPSILM